MGGYRGLKGSKYLVCVYINLNQGVGKDTLFISISMKCYGLEKVKYYKLLCAKCHTLFEKLYLYLYSGQIYM